MRVLPAVAALLFGVAFLGASLESDVEASAAVFVPHDRLVPEVPRTNHPIIIGAADGRDFDGSVVYAADQVGRNIVAGGNFQTIELRDGRTINHPYFLAYDIESGDPVCLNQFVFNDVVRSVERGLSATQLYVGGDFTKVTGADGVERTRNKIVLIDLADCSVDRTFVSIGADGRVTAMERLGNRLFVGGDFTQISESPIEKLAELDAITGAPNPAFDFEFRLETAGGRSFPPSVMDLGINVERSRLVVGGRFGRIVGNGFNIPAPTAVIDISDPATPLLTGHETRGYLGNAGAEIRLLSDVDISPDGSRLAVSGAGTPQADWVYMFDIEESVRDPLWTLYIGDSTFAVGVANNAVYIGGHFCRIAPGPGGAEQLAPQPGAPGCTFENNTTHVWRSQVAALDINDGTPLVWNPGSDAFVGSREMTITTRGVLMGYDGNRVNSRRVGALAFWDFGPAAEDPLRPMVSAIPDQATVGPRRIDVAIAATDPNGDELSFRADGLPAGVTMDERDGRLRGSVSDPGTYEVVVTATNSQGLSGSTSFTWTVGSQECTATLNADLSVSLSWTAVDGEDRYIVRGDDNASFVASTDAVSFEVSADQAADGPFWVRSREAGVTTNTLCVGDIEIPEPEPVPPQECTATLNADLSVSLSWTAVDGEDRYIVRGDDNATFVAIAADVLSFEVPADQAANGPFWVRSREAGVTTNTLCVGDIDIPDPA